MRKNILSLLFLFCLVVTSKATIRRVGFTDVPPLVGVDYTTFYAAHQAAVDGDTIYVFPGKPIASTDWPAINNRPTIAKRLIIISKGNLLDTATAPKGNAGLQAVPGTGIKGATDYMGFAATSSGSVLMGFDLQGLEVRVSANNITIKRNLNLTVYFAGVSVSNLLVEGNYRVGFTGLDDASDVWSNVQIRNNLISHMYLFPLKSYSGVIANNTIAYDATAPSVNGGSSSMSNANTGISSVNNILLQGGTWLFENNLIGTITNNNVSLNVGYDFGGTENTTFNNNVAIQASNFSVWPSNGTGNVVLTPAQVPLIFEAFPSIGTSSADGRYRLKAGSPAFAGSSVRPSATVDAGMYGGSTPYKLGMIPSIPSIYNINSPQGNSPSGNTLHVNLSIRSNN